MTTPTVQTNPYAPPQAKVADPEPNSHGLKQRRVIVMVVFMIISLGFYYLVWWFRRRPGLNRLNSEDKLPLWPLLLLAAQYAVQFVLGVAEGLDPETDLVGETGRAVLAFFRILVGIVMVFQAFKIKSIIEDHATPADSGPMFVEHVQLSGLMTFFFSLFYLQWAINRYVVGAEVERV